jgi:cyclopropane fatty-acyl-phospholipid synthase-like methyltransferase
MGGGGEIIGYEPYMDSIPNNMVAILRDYSEVEQMSPFDTVTCFEVLEHFNKNMQKELLEKMYSVLGNDGYLIISVPIEKGLPSVVKNIIRRNFCKDPITYSAKNIIASFWGKQIPEFRNPDGYLSHIGFYLKDLEPIFFPYFEIIKRSFSPFSFLGSKINSQVFYVLKKRPICSPLPSLQH